MGASRRRTLGRGLKRRVAVRQPRKTILIFCEGERTEPEYLNAQRHQPWVRDIAAVDLRVQSKRGGLAPRTLVSHAVDAWHKTLSEAAEIDEVWCVFDVEWPQNHPGLLDAVELAQRGGVLLAISNPCFELWLVLHFQDCGAWLDNDHASQLRRRLDRSDNKGIDAIAYMSLVHEAARRARDLETRHRSNGTSFPHDNPSSGMHRLIATIEQDRTP